MSRSVPYFRYGMAAVHADDIFFTLAVTKFQEFYRDSQPRIEGVVDANQDMVLRLLPRMTLEQPRWSEIRLDALVDDRRGTKFP